MFTLIIFSILLLPLILFAAKCPELAAEAAACQQKPLTTLQALAHF
jgi:hypothetical protein